MAKGPKQERITMKDMRKLMETVSDLEEAPVKKKGHFKAKAVPPKNYSAANDELLNLCEVMSELFYEASLPSEVERKFQDFYEALVRATDAN